MLRKPSWQSYHNLGEFVAPKLPVQDSYTNIAKHFGCRKQKIYHEAMVALGKVIYRCRKSIKNEA